MSKVIAAVRPRQDRLWRVVLIAAIVLSALIPGALIARADDGKHSEDGRFVITANVWIVNPGTIDPITGKRFKTSGEVIVGCISSSGWEAVRVDPACSPSNPSLIVTHSSITTVAPNGTIAGNATGGFTTADKKVNGKYAGQIAALYNPAFGFFKGFPMGIYHIQDRGTWEAEDAKGHEVEGRFTLTIDFQGMTADGKPILAGLAVLEGKHD